MKKVLSLVLALLMCVTSFAFVASAGETAAAKYSIVFGKYEQISIPMPPFVSGTIGVDTEKSTSLNKGDTAIIAVRLDENPGLTAANIEVVAPAGVFELAEYEATEYESYYADGTLGIYPQGAAVTTNFFNESGNIIIGGMAQPATTATGHLYCFKVKVVTDEPMAASFNIRYTDGLETNHNNDGVLVPLTCEPFTLYLNGYTGETVCEHEETEEDVTDATCTEDGSKVVTCTVCGEVISEEVLPATGHTPGEPVVVDPDCDTEGSSTVSCEVCGEVISEEVLPATGHTPGEPEVIEDATCDGTGVTVIRCEVCDEILETLDAPPANGHTAGQPVVTPATCTEDGSSTVYCTVCGEVMSEDVIKATGHTPGTPEVTDDPTCDGTGTTVTRCETCGEVVKTEDAPPATGHNYGAPVVTPATCTEDGSSEVTCATCGDTQTTPIPATGHTLAVEYKPATFEAAGYKKVTCSECDYEETTVIDMVEDNHFAEAAQNNKAYFEAEGNDVKIVAGINSIWAGEFGFIITGHESRVNATLEDALADTDKYIVAAVENAFGFVDGKTAQEALGHSYAIALKLVGVPEEFHNNTFYAKAYIKFDNGYATQYIDLGSFTVSELKD